MSTRAEMRVIRNVDTGASIIARAVIVDDMVYVGAAMAWGAYSKREVWAAEANAPIFVRIDLHGNAIIASLLSDEDNCKIHNELCPGKVSGGDENG